MNGVAHTALIWLKALLCPDVKSDGTPRTAAYWRDNLPYWIPHDKTIAAKAEVALEFPINSTSVLCAHPDLTLPDTTSLSLVLERTG